MRRFALRMTWAMGVIGAVSVMFGAMSFLGSLATLGFSNGSRMDATVLTGVGLVSFVIASSLIRAYSFSAKELCTPPIEREEQA